MGPHTIFGRPPYGSSKAMKLGTQTHTESVKRASRSLAIRFFLEAIWSVKNHGFWKKKKTSLIFFGHKFTIYDLKRSHRQAILIVKTQGFWTHTRTNLDTNSHTLDLRRFFVDPPIVFRKPCFLSRKTPHTIFGRLPYGSSKIMKFGTPHTVLAHFELPGSQICDPSHTFGCQDPTSEHKKNSDVQNIRIRNTFQSKHRDIHTDTHRQTDTHRHTHRHTHTQ